MNNKGRKGDIKWHGVLPETKRLVDGSAAGWAATGSGEEKAEMEKSRRNSDSDAGAAVARGGGEMAEIEKIRRNPALAAAISVALSFVSECSRTARYL